MTFYRLWRVIIVLIRPINTVKLTARNVSGTNWNPKYFNIDRQLKSKTGLIHIQKNVSVGAELVQAGHAVYGNVEVEQIEDSLITGALTSKILKLKMAQYYGKDLSYC